MAKRSVDPAAPVAVEQQAQGLEAGPPVEAAEPTERTEGGDARPAAPPPVPDPPKDPPRDPPTTVTLIERFHVETSVYYVPHLGFGAVYVPAGTIITRASHDVQKLIEQGAKLRPVLDE
jgi:hypothetical protein